jgi:Polysaccharide lyase family 4, domain II
MPLLPYAPRLLARPLVAGALLLVAAPARSQVPPPAEDWPGERMPLPLAVQNAEDLAFKDVAERQYLLFNLLAGGKRAYDAGDMATAAARWEALLRVPGLPADVERTVRPLAARARAKAGSAPASGVTLPPSVLAPTPLAPRAEAPSPAAPATQAHVTGRVSGGGRKGPGGAVVWLKRVDGRTPPVRPEPRRTVVQKDKRFIPHVLAVTPGTPVAFVNADTIHHNVFSLSHPNDFDLGMAARDVTHERTFTQPGPVSLLCNIHSSMSAHIYVVDTPYYAQADAEGRFTIRNVPPGDYTLEAWHEDSLAPTRKTVRVGASGARVTVHVKADRTATSFVPDKAGQPRQPQLGY